MTDEKTNILRASLDSSDLAGQVLETVAEQAVEIASLRAANAAYYSTLLDVAGYLMNDLCKQIESLTVSDKETFAEQPQLIPVAKQLAPNDTWCPGCNPDNCMGCDTGDERW